MTEFSTRTARIYLDDDGILVQDLFDTDLTLEDVRENEAAMTSLAGGARPRLLARIDLVKKVSPEARAYTATEDYAAQFLALAIVTSKPIPRVIGSFWMAVNRPALSTKMFADEGPARAWLHGL